VKVASGESLWKSLEAEVLRHLSKVSLWGAKWLGSNIAENRQLATVCNKLYVPNHAWCKIQ